MTTFASRFRAPAFLVFATALCACGGGGGSSSQSAGMLPAATTVVPLVSSGPVTYMQSNGPLSSSGTIAKGSSSALVAVMSAAQGVSAFSTDTLTLSTGASSQSAVRAAQPAARVLNPAHPHAPEAFAANDAALIAKLQLQRAVPVATRNMEQRASPVQTAAVGAQLPVWVQQGGYASSTNIQVPATLLAQSAHGNIWVQSTLVSTLSSQTAQLAADFENAYASDTAHFASPDYSSGAPALQTQYSTCAPGGARQGTAPAYITEPADGRINVLIVDSSSLGGIGGYFSAANFMTQGALNCLNAGYESNQAPFIFVGWFPGYGTNYELREDMVRSTAHELQHLINFVNHGLLAPGAGNASFNGNEAQYLNEGLSMLAQDFAIDRLYGGQGVHFDAADALPRAQAYLADPSAFSITGFSGIDAGAWGGNGSARFNCSGGCYGGAYLFARYLRDRFGDSFTHSIETSGTTGAANLQAVTGEDAGQLLGDFALSMAAGTLGVTPSDPRFAFGSLLLKGNYTDQFGAVTALSGAASQQASGATTAVRAPLGGFAFVQMSNIAAGGQTVQVSDQQAVGGFSLLGGLAQH